MCGRREASNSLQCLQSKKLLVRRKVASSLSFPIYSFLGLTVSKKLVYWV